MGWETVGGDFFENEKKTRLSNKKQKKKGWDIVLRLFCYSVLFFLSLFSFVFLYCFRADFYLFVFVYLVYLGLMLGVYFFKNDEE